MRYINPRLTLTLTLTLTWHDSVDSPQLIACAPEGYHYVEKARPRLQSESLSFIDAVNHGGVCLLFDQHLCARQITLPSSPSFEAVCAYVHRSGFNAYIRHLPVPTGLACSD